MWIPSRTTTRTMYSSRIRFFGFVRALAERALLGVHDGTAGCLRHVGRREDGAYVDRDVRRRLGVRRRARTWRGISREGVRFRSVTTGHDEREQSRNERAIHRARLREGATRRHCSHAYAVTIARRPARLAWHHPRVMPVPAVSRACPLVSALTLALAVLAGGAGCVRPSATARAQALLRRGTRRRGRCLCSSVSRRIPTTWPPGAS